LAPGESPPIRLYIRRFRRLMANQPSDLSKIAGAPSFTVWDWISSQRASSPGSGRDRPRVHRRHRRWTFQATRSAGAWICVVACSHCSLQRNVEFLRCRLARGIFSGIHRRWTRYWKLICCWLQENFFGCDQQTVLWFYWLKRSQHWPA
jgi:hypothetical protein